MERRDATLLRNAMERPLYLGRDGGHPAPLYRQAARLMWRVLFEQLLLFLAPFAIYAISLGVRRQLAFSRHHWPRHILVRLAIVGLALAVAGLVYFGFSAPQQKGVYAPAHMENGRVTPGRFQ
jgi:hypothetical protein